MFTRLRSWLRRKWNHFTSYPWRDPAGWECLDSYTCPNGIEIGRIGKRVWLCLVDGKYHLISGNGYIGDDDFHTFLKQPIPDPDPNESFDVDKDEDAYKRWNAWEEEASLECENMKFLPQTGEFLMENCRLAGFGTKKQTYETGRFSLWLYHYCGEMIQQREAKIAAKHELYKTWKAHLTECEHCRKIRWGQPDGTKEAKIAKKCCSVGKPLYEKFLQS